MMLLPDPPAIAAVVARPARRLCPAYLPASNPTLSASFFNNACHIATGQTTGSSTVDGPEQGTAHDPGQSVQGLKRPNGAGVVAIRDTNLAACALLIGLIPVPATGLESPTISASYGVQLSITARMTPTFAGR
jgi:hypothetical protein